MRVGNVVELQQPCDGITIDLTVKRRMWLERLQLRAKEQRAIRHPAIIQRLLAQTIAAQMQQLLIAIPHGKGEHAVETLRRRLHAPLAESGQHDLRVAVTTKRMTGCLKLGAQIAEVIHLAIENDDESSVARDHGLMSLRRQIKNR